MGLFYLHKAGGIDKERLGELSEAKSRQSGKACPDAHREIGRPSLKSSESEPDTPSPRPCQVLLERILLLHQKSGNACLSCFELPGHEKYNDFSTEYQSISYSNLNVNSNALSFAKGECPRQVGDEGISNLPYPGQKEIAMKRTTVVSSATWWD